MPLLFGHDADVADWVAGKMGGLVVFPHAAIGMLDHNGVLRGAFVFAFHNAHTAELTLYSENVITNDMWRGAMSWVFEDIGIGRLQIRTERKNKAVKRAAPKFGFRFEGVARDYFGPGDDALLYYMTPATCRWIGAHGPIQNTQAAQAA